MDICALHHDYLLNVRKNKECRVACCNKSTLKYCEHFRHGLPEVVVAIVPDDVTIVNKNIKRGESEYKNIYEYTKDYKITKEQVNKILRKKIRRDTRFFKKIRRVEEMLESSEYAIVSPEIDDMIVEQVTSKLS